MIFRDTTRAETPRSRRADGVEIARVASAFDYAQAALLLGEQRAFTERLLGRELAEVQPSSQREYAHLASYYRPPHGKLLIARLHGEPVGILGVRRIDSRRGESKRLYVRPSARGHGIARMLVQELFVVTRELGLSALYCETSPTLLPQSYEMCVRLGFTETEKLGFADVDDVIAMQIELDPVADDVAPSRAVSPTRRFRRARELRVA
jgi:GNAT superfamily N-acetyltransferase